ncbi:MAG: GFA family protein [Pseudomonadota bacterium]
MGDVPSWQVCEEVNLAEVSLPLRGGCQCAAVRYEISVEPQALYVCHCTECRGQSGSAFGISVYVERSAFKVVGETRNWTRPSDSGLPTHCHFCAVCGSRVWHDGPPDDPIVSVKGGTLDTPPDLSEAVHVWTRSKLPGVIIPAGAEQHSAEPD